MRVTSLGSGSSGNAYVVEAGPAKRTKLLVDAGFSSRVLVERLHLAGVTPHQLHGVLITHEHSDHIVGLPFLMKRYHKPVFADPLTLQELETILSMGELRSEAGARVILETELLTTITPGLSSQEELVVVQTLEVEPPVAELQTLEIKPEAGLWRALPAGSTTLIGDIEVTTFPVSHDAKAPTGYLLSAGGCRVCIVTDTGMVTPAMLEAIAQADLLILESNHERARLLSGPYPYYLKQRILSPTGHLSNEQAAEAVLRTWRPDGIRWLWLAHLSRTNNTPRLALSSMQNYLRSAGANLSQIHISVLKHESSMCWDSTLLWLDSSLWEM